MCYCAMFANFEPIHHFDEIFYFSINHTMFTVNGCSDSKFTRIFGLCMLSSPEPRSKSHFLVDHIISVRYSTLKVADMDNIN